MANPTNPLNLPNLTMANLPSKFHTNLLGHVKCTDARAEGLQARVQTAFANNTLVRLKDDYVSTINDTESNAPAWVVKGESTGTPMTPDTHIYRIRKAEKISRYIESHNLQDIITVPKKFLYHNEQNGKFYTISEYLDLSNEVAKPSEEMRDLFDRMPSWQATEGQLRAYKTRFPRRALTPEQAKALAELSVLGYTDLTYNNMFFTQDGKVAILDTEPVKRLLKKSVSNNPLTACLIDKDALWTQQSIVGMAKLKMACSTPATVQEVEKVEKNAAMWTIAKLVCKIAIACLALYFLPAALIPVSGLLATCVKACLIAKTLMLVSQLFTTAIAWHLSCKPDPTEGAGVLAQMEMAGVF